MVFIYQIVLRNNLCESLLRLNRRSFVSCTKCKLFNLVWQYYGIEKKRIGDWIKTCCLELGTGFKLFFVFFSILSVVCGKRIQIKIDFFFEENRPRVRLDGSVWMGPKTYTFCDYLEQNGDRLGWEKAWLVRDYHAKLMTMTGGKQWIFAVIISWSSIIRYCRQTIVVKYR